MCLNTYRKRNHPPFMALALYSKQRGRYVYGKIRPSFSNDIEAMDRIGSVYICSAAAKAL